MTRSSVKKTCVTSFTVYRPFFLCLFALARTSSASVCAFFLESCSLFPLNRILAVSFIRFRAFCSVPSFLRSLSSMAEFCQILFLPLLKWSSTFLFMMNNSKWFSNIKANLLSWDGSPCHDALFFLTLWWLVSLYFCQGFCLYVHERY